MDEKNSPPDGTERAKELKSTKLTLSILSALSLIQSAAICGLILRFNRLVQIIGDLGEIVSGQGQILQKFETIVSGHGEIIQTIEAILGTLIESVNQIADILSRF